MVLTWIISVIFPKIDKVIGIMGGLCASTLCYALPTYCFVKLSGKAWTSPKNLLLIVPFGCMTLIGYTSVIIIIFEIATGCNTMRDFNRGSCN